jgi:DNA polymerase-1
MSNPRPQVRIRWDLEGDGLLDDVTQVHCLSFRVKGSAKMHRAVGKAQVVAALRALDKADVIVGHNIIGYDLMVLHKLYGWKPKAQVVDTFLDARLLHPDTGDDHSLEDWGVRLGCPKTDYEAAYKAHARVEWVKAWGEADYPVSAYYQPGDEWKAYNPVMGDYCDQDVCVTEKLDDHLQAGFAADAGKVDWEPARRMEHAFAREFALQGKTGVCVDVAYGEELVATITAEMEAIAAEVEPLLPDRDGTMAELDDVTPPKLLVKKDGTPSANAAKWFEEIRPLADYKYEGLWRGTWYRFDDLAMKPDGSEREPLVNRFPGRLEHQQHIKAWLMDQGWRPTMWNFKKEKDKNGKLRDKRGDDGKKVVSWPKFHDKGKLCENLEAMLSGDQETGLDGDLVRKVVRWVVIRHRRGFVKSILKAVRPDGRVSATGYSLGTPTSRVKHKVVANCPKADPDVVLGAECRRLFVAAPGLVLVGADAAGLELRMLAHRVGTQELVHIIVDGKKEDGTDIHTVLGKAYEEYAPLKVMRKPINYGWLYGASDTKLGLIGGHGENKAEKVGAKIRALLIAAIPGLDELMKKIEAAAKTGHIIGMDGRKIPIRSKHATLNTLLQSDGSIIVKWATCWCMAKIREAGLRARLVIHYHDEVVLECHPDDAQAAGELFIKGIKWAGHLFKVRCPLSGDMTIGNNWAEIH